MIQLDALPLYRDHTFAFQIIHVLVSARSHVNLTIEALWINGMMPESWYNLSIVAWHDAY